jgi:hypothetical protein
VGRILTPEALALFLFFVVPGFVMIRTYDLIVPTERRNFGESFVDLFAYSFLILAVWFLPFFALVDNRESIHPVVYYSLFAVVLVLVFFVSPIALAVGYYRLRTSDWLSRQTRKLVKGEIPSPSPTPWDFFFQEDRAVLVRFHLHSGERFGGLYAKGANASSFPQAQQIYVKTLYRLEEDGGFAEEVEDSLGAIINKEDCKMIEFLQAEEQ